MDILQMATTAAALVAPYLTKAGEAAAKQAGTSAWKKMENLYQVIRRKFASGEDSYAQKALERLAEHPDTEECRAAFAHVLTEKAQADPAFAQELARLVEDAIKDRGISQFVTQVYGKAKVGKIINIGQSDIVQID